MSQQDRRIEDAFHAFLTGDALKNALAFAEFVRANEMHYDGEYEIQYKNECVCYIDAPTERNKLWSVWTVGDYRSEYEGFPINERTKEIAWSNVVKCGNCADTDCDPGKTEVIFGKKFANVCNGTDSLAMRFINPDAEAVQCAIKMVGITKHAIDHRA